MLWPVRFLSLLLSPVPLISFSKPLGTVPGSPSTIGITTISFLTAFFFYLSGNIQVFVYLFAFFCHNMVSWNCKIPLDEKFFFFSRWLTLGFNSLLASFFYHRLLVVFHWVLRDCKSPKISRTLLSILADFNNAIIWFVSIRSPIPNSSSPLSKLLVTVPSTPNTICITDTLIFYSFLSSQALSKYLSLFFFFSIFFIFTQWTTGKAKFSIQQVLFCFVFYCFVFLLIMTRSGLLDRVTRLYLKIKENFMI